VLDRCGAQVGADLAEQDLSIPALDTVDAHLDQLVRLEAALDLGENGFAQPFLADAGDGTQAVGAGAQGAALGRGQFKH